MLEEVIEGQGVAIKNALGREPQPEVDYHSMGFDVFIELIQFGLNNPKVIQAATTNSFIQNLNELL